MLLLHFRLPDLSNSKLKDFLNQMWYHCASSIYFHSTMWYYLITPKFYNMRKRKIVLQFVCATHDFKELFIDSSPLNSFWYERCSSDHPCCTLSIFENDAYYSRCKIASSINSGMISVPSKTYSLFPTIFLIIPYIPSFALCSLLKWHLLYNYLY